MMKRSIFLMAMAVFISFNFKAQWAVLPAASYSPGGSFNCNSLIVPDLIVPFADDKIAYTTYCYFSPSSGSKSQISISEDNLTSMHFTKTFPQGLGQKIFSMVVQNVNTFAYYRADFQYGLFYTRDKFDTITQKATVFNSQPMAINITSSFIYAIGQVDSAYITQYMKSGTQSVKRGFINYIPENNKLSFMNDSVGFTLAHAVSNTSKTALFRIKGNAMSQDILMTDSIDAIVDYSFTSQGHLFVLKKSGAVYKSTDQGLSFLPLTALPTGTYTCLRFANGYKGYVGGVNGNLLKTENGGNTWTYEISNTTEDIKAIYTFVYTSYFVNASKRVYRSVQPLGINDITANDDLFIFPNPASDRLKILYDSKIIKADNIQLTDISGRIIIEKLFDDTDNLDISVLPAGVYILKLFAYEKVLKTQKIIISR